ncbi:dynein heavy chain, partial [Trypanosoma cruzi]
DLIGLAAEHVNIEEFAKNIEKKDALTRLGETLAVCGQFKAAYFHYKSYVSTMARPWKFQNTAFFFRLDVFLERCHDLLDVMETAVLFDKMENIKVGGTKSQMLTKEAEEIKAEFDEAYMNFFGVEYNMLDVDDPRFDTNYSQFRATIRELERRLGAILVTTIDDAKAISEVFKAVDTFDGFTDHAVVQLEWSKKQKAVLEAFHEDL